MKDEEPGDEALVPAFRAKLSASRSSCLIARACTDLQNGEKAAEWRRKGMQLLDSAPLSYANTPSDFRVKVRLFAECTSQISHGSGANSAANALGMSREDQEFAHVAYFFLPEALARAAGQQLLPPPRTQPQPTDADTFGPCAFKSPHVSCVPLPE